ncbi:uncharacterized protein EI90DRAFT_3293971 [Cantharellus anzutake]|uniref:uncharacterized protein n=1 Tax=Cantharellus anzutake TaxID=1750568 RepID=UPI001905F287|nr:uncharacterized protein EI90DRAFT_3293971 [Cantharellus anzutake]KAF8315288.1 hypothetical protein EI90DRAFT_3293971 [Cantharellus anzutake]
MSVTLHLNCWLLGDDASQVFPVAISKTATVGILSHQRAEDGRFPTPRTLEGFHPSRRRTIASEEIVLQDLHIIIRFPRVVPQLDPPILELYCLIHGDGANHIFPVQIASTESVGTLKKAIKEEKFALPHIDADTLNSGRDYLPSTSGWISTHHCSVSPRISNRVPKGRAEWASKFAQKAPSEKGKPKNFAADQRRNPPAFCFNRPPSTAATIPITLHNPIFGQFQDDCKTYIPTKADHDLKLSSSMSEFCDAEKGRVEKILESEIILGSAEPIFEAAWYYAANLGSNLPCFILYIAGEVACALLWTIRPHLQVVAPTLPLFYHTSDVDMWMQTACFLGAFVHQYSKEPSQILIIGIRAFLRLSAVPGGWYMVVINFIDNTYHELEDSYAKASFETGRRPVSTKQDMCTVTFELPTSW